MHRRIPLCVLICLALAACGLPKPRPAADVELDREFTAKFGIPGSVPLQPIKPRGVLEIGASRIFGDPVDPTTIIKPPPPVPPIRVEPIPRAPRVGQYSWQPSAWEWNGYAFVWKLGAWVQPPPGAQWTNGQWTKNDLGEWIWLTGGWV
jgi:hypothetical protein